MFNADIDAGQSVFRSLADQFDTALENLATKWRDLGVAFFLAVVALLITLISFNFAEQIVMPRLMNAITSGPWWDGFFQNFGTEMFGALATFILLQGIVGAREKKQDQELQERIAAQIRDELRSYFQAQELARLRAATTAEERQPILDSMSKTGLLVGADFWRSSLAGARLRGADMRGASFKQTDVTGADLRYTKLDEATFKEMNFAGANLDGAQLSGASLVAAGFDNAYLEGAKLNGADLRGANLRQAHMAHANLSNANVRNAIFQGADMRSTNLEGLLLVTLEQLKQAKILAGATLPDGAVLPKDDAWEAAFNTWSTEVPTKRVSSPLAEGRFIISTQTEDNTALWSILFVED